MGAQKLTHLEGCVLHWLQCREMVPAQRDLFAEWPDNQEQTLLRIMRQLVAKGWAKEKHGGWVHATLARPSKGAK